KKKTASSSSLRLATAALKHLTVGVIDVDLPKTLVVSSSGTTQASLAAAYSEKRPGPLTAEAYVVAAGTAPDVRSHYRADLALDTDFLKRGQVTRLDLKARLRGDAGLRA